MYFESFDNVYVCCVEMIYIFLCVFHWSRDIMAYSKRVYIEDLGLSCVYSTRWCVCFCMVCFRQCPGHWSEHKGMDFSIYEGDERVERWKYPLAE